MGMTDKFPDQQIKEVLTELCESIDAFKVYAISAALIEHRTKVNNTLYIECSRLRETSKREARGAN